jgi:hypothetical protein
LKIREKCKLTMKKDLTNAITQKYSINKWYLLEMDLINTHPPSPDTSAKVSINQKNIDHLIAKKKNSKKLRIMCGFNLIEFKSGFISVIQ